MELLTPHDLGIIAATLDDTRHLGGDSVYDHLFAAIFNEIAFDEYVASEIAYHYAYLA